MDLSVFGFFDVFPICFEFPQNLVLARLFETGMDSSACFHNFYDSLMNYELFD